MIHKIENQPAIKHLTKAVVDKGEMKVSEKVN